VKESAWTGFGLETGVIDHFNTRLVPAINYSSRDDFSTLQITTAHPKTFQSAVFTGRSLITVSNSGDSPASALTSLSADSQLHRLSLLVTDSLTILSELLL
jgi:hypothetical protein